MFVFHVHLRSLFWRTGGGLPLFDVYLMDVLWSNLNRAAIEYERKARAHNFELSQQMEKNMVSMGQEVQKLQADLANADKRVQAATAAAATATNTGIPFL